MDLYSVVGESFFKPLVSQFKVIYLECLKIIYDSYRSELSYGIDRETLVSKLVYYFESSNISDIEFDDDNEILHDSRTKATTFLRKLKDFGWIEYEISNNQTAKVVMPDHAVSMIQVLIDISNPREMEYQSEISLIYSTLTNEELLGRPYPQILKPVLERTHALFDGLKKLNTSIRKYIESITADKSSEEIIRDFFTYNDEIGSKAYHRIKTEENISRFRNAIIQSACAIYSTIPSSSCALSRDTRASKMKMDYTDAENAVKGQISEIIDSFRNYDEIVNEIDKKHSKYLKNAVERAKFLLLNTNNAEGKISSVLRYMADGFNHDEQNNLLEDASDEICSLFNIFTPGYLSGESFKTVAISKKLTEVDEIYEPLGLSSEERERYRIAISEKNKNRFTKKNIEKYVANLLSRKEILRASELPLESRRDLIRIVFISLYGHSSTCGYKIKPLNEIISANHFKFRDFEIRRS